MTTQDRSPRRPRFVLGSWVPSAHPRHPARTRGISACHLMAIPKAGRHHNDRGPPANLLRSPIASAPQAFVLDLQLGASTVGNHAGLDGGSRVHGGLVRTASTSLRHRSKTPSHTREGPHSRAWVRRRSPVHRMGSTSNSTSISSVEGFASRPTPPNATTMGLSLGRSVP